jgi:biotin transport system substrate-specific component
MKVSLDSFEVPLKNVWVKDLSISLVASLALALFAPLTFVIPFSPIPVTFQVQAALLFSLILGPKRAFFMVLFFLLQGISNLPVFAGGATSIFNLIGPRGGYLIGYLAASFIVPLFFTLFNKKGFFQVFLSLCLGNIIVYAFGYCWLSKFLGMAKAFSMGVMPFIFVDFVKLLIAALLFEITRKVLNCFGKSSC